jgi:hypothetical protein
MDEEDGRLGPPRGHIVGDGASKCGPRQQPGSEDSGRLQKLIDVTDGRARQTGRADVLTDALANSLCHHPNISVSDPPALRIGFMAGVVSISKQSSEGEMS